MLQMYSKGAVSELVEEVTQLKNILQYRDSTIERLNALVDSLLDEIEAKNDVISMLESKS